MSSAVVRGVSYAFPTGTRTVEELAKSGLLLSDSSVLERFGFGRVHVADGESPYDLSVKAARSVLDEQGLAPGDVELLVYAGVSGSAAFDPTNATSAAGSRITAGERFRFPATRLQYDLGLVGASALGVDQLAGSGLFGAVRVARAMCLAEGIELALCVSADVTPSGAFREATFSCLSDAACAVLVARGGARNRIVATSHRTRGYYWDGRRTDEAFFAAYYPTATEVIRKTLADARWSADDVDWVIPHNIGLQSWEILMRLCGLTRARVWSRNIPRAGQTLAGDNFINFRDALATGSVLRGDRLLLFSFSHGAHWTALAVEA